MRIESELINACVQVFDQKLKIVQDLLVARTEMMVLGDSVVTLDMKALETKYAQLSRVVADNVKNLKNKNVSRLSIEDLERVSSKTAVPRLSETSAPPSNALFDKGITMLTDEIRVLQSQLTIAKDRLNTVKNEINSLEAEVLASTNSTASKSITTNTSTYDMEIQML